MKTYLLTLLAMCLWAGIVPLFLVGAGLYLRNMYAATTSVTLVGGEVRPVLVEAHVGRQQDKFKLSGLPDTAVREAKDRVRAAVTSSGIRFPNRTVTVNLAPADLPKRGTDYDLPIALGILAASGEIPVLAKVIVAGELALDGAVRPATNALAAGVLSSRTQTPCLVGQQSVRSAATVPGSTAYGVGTLAEAVHLVQNQFHGTEPVRPEPLRSAHRGQDMSDVDGQPVARRALEIAAAGGHHLLFHGPPGSGKTMLASRLPGILPNLAIEEAIEVTLLWAAAGRDREIDDPPPFRAPHHTASRAALVGGGVGVARPGEVSLAHRGVLFLDELAEFPRGHLDTLRQPLEEGCVTIARKDATTRFPAAFQLVAATNPCPCGYWGDRRRPCVCRSSARERYRGRISGPLIDRFDMIVNVARLEPDAYGRADGEKSATIRDRVTRARATQARRGILNRDLPPQIADIDSLSRKLVISALEKGLVTARGAGKLQRVARTVADLDGSDSVEEAHVAEALALRSEWDES